MSKFAKATDKGFSPTVRATRKPKYDADEVKEARKLITETVRSKQTKTLTFPSTADAEQAAKLLRYAGDAKGKAYVKVEGKTLTFHAAKPTPKPRDDDGRVLRIDGTLRKPRNSGPEA